MAKPVLLRNVAIVKELETSTMWTTLWASMTTRTKAGRLSQDLSVAGLSLVSSSLALDSVHWLQLAHKLCLERKVGRTPSTSRKVTGQTMMRKQMNLSEFIPLVVDLLLARSD